MPSLTATDYKVRCALLLASKGMNTGRAGFVRFRF